MATDFLVASSRWASLCSRRTQFQYQIAKIFRHKQTILLGIVRINDPFRGCPIPKARASIEFLRSQPLIPIQWRLRAHTEILQKLQQHRKQRDLHSLPNLSLQELRKMLFTTTSPVVGQLPAGFRLLVGPGARPKKKEVLLNRSTFNLDIPDNSDREYTKGYWGTEYGMNTWCRPGGFV